jgi:tetratricopeptide (TPR) repeat protein
MRDWESSIAQWEAILEIDPLNVQSYGNIVEIELLSGNRQVAAEKLERALSKLPQEGRLLYLRGVIAWDLGRIKELLTSWSEVQKNAPDILYGYSDRIRELLGTDGYSKLLAVAEPVHKGLLEDLDRVLSGQTEQLVLSQQREKTQKRNSFADRIRGIFRS